MDYTEHNCDYCYKFVELDFESTVYFNGTEYMHETCHYESMKGKYELLEESRAIIAEITRRGGAGPGDFRLPGAISNVAMCLRRIKQLQEFGKVYL